MANKDFHASSPIETGVDIVNSAGEVVDHVSYGTGGAKGITGTPVYKATDGSWTTDPLKTVNFSLDADGNIKITAPKFLTDLPEFQQIFDSDVLKSYSAAYKTDPSFRVPFKQLNEDGTTEETQVTIPEFIEKLNSSSLPSFVENYRVAEQNRAQLRNKYGEKADNLSLTQLSALGSVGANSQRIYLPDFIFDFDNDFKSLKDKVDEYGTVSSEEFMEVYNRSKVDAKDLAAIMSAIEGHIRASDWGEEEVMLEDGTVMKNGNSANEAMKAMALKQFILSRDPDSEWWQKTGDFIVTATANAADGFTSVILNTLGAVEYGATFGHSAHLLDINEQKQEAFSEWSEDRMLIQDSTAVARTLGEIGGALAGTALEAWLAKGVSAAASNFYEAKLAEGLASRNALLSMGPSAAAALSPETYAAAVEGITNISLGAQFVMRVAPLAEKLAWAKGLYEIYMAGNAVENTILSKTAGLILDTFHDVIVYDAVTLRHVLENSDDSQVREYWANQFADNMKWWVGIGVAKGLVKGAGSTELGQTLNAVVSQKVQKGIATVGDKKDAIKDYFYGGDFVRHMEDELETLKDGPKKNRLINKINQARLNQELRKARFAFGDMDLDFDGLKLTEESADKYREATTEIRRAELAIDHYNQDLAFKRQEMIGLTKDPATGRWIYYNPDLGVASKNAMNVTSKLMDFTDKYNLTVGKRSLIGQDIVDYLVGSQDLKIKSAIASAGGPDALKASRDVEVIRSNLANLENVLPADVLAYLKNGDTIKAYTDFYYQLNEYGIAKGLIDADTIQSYRENPIWAQNGYMPVEKEIPFGGRWVAEDGRYHAKLSQDIQHFDYSTKPGQHYVDPEITRQIRINTMAKTEVNNELFKTFRNIEDATATTFISGEDTARVKAWKSSEKALDTAIADYSKGLAGDLDIDVTKKGRKALIRNVHFELAERSEVISTFSLSETTQILQDKRVLRSGNTKLSNLVSAENYDAWYKEQSTPVKNYLSAEYEKIGGAKGSNDYGLFSRAYSLGGTDFEAGLQRAYLSGDEKFAKSSVFNRAARNFADGKEAFYDTYLVSRTKANLKNIQGLDTDEFVDSLQTSAKKMVDNYVAGVLEDKRARAALNAVAGENGVDLAGKYTALKWLKTKGKKGLADIVSTQVNKNVAEKAGKVSAKDLATLRDNAIRFFDDYIRNELNDAANALRTVNPNLVRNKNIYDEVNALAREIEGAKTSSNVIMYLDPQGRQAYAEVDPNFASLYSYRYQMVRVEASAFAKANEAMSRLFRLGTTTMNVSSWGNQLVKDTGHALLVGGAWQTVKGSADNLVDVFGENIVDQIKRFDPTGYEMKQLSAIAEQTGQSLEEAAVSRELVRGAAASPATTETTLYKQFMNQAYGGTDSLLTNAKDKLEGLIGKYSLDDLVNGRRENYLRNRVYASNLDRALTQGYSLEQARVFAEFAMNNATTNFSRQLYHMQAIADSTPYFRAAINGTKSFWRMWSLDPVGISGRIMGGLVLPTIFLTGASLGDPENEKIYKSIPEYQKRGNLIFVVDKQVITIPVPEEISTLISPYRQFVEALHGQNTGDFWELMMSDVLGLSPVDLTGFSTIDMDRMTREPTIADRISRGFAKVFAQVAPVPVKSTYMLATGTDPYTGKKLYDPSYAYWDDTTNTLQTMDYNQNAFAKKIADLFGKNGASKRLASAALLEKVVSGTIGSAGSNLLGEITALVTDGGEAWLKTAGENITEAATSPFSTETYDQIDVIWKRAVRELTAEKNAILASDEFRAIYTELAQTKDEEKRNKLKAKGQDLINEYQQKVGDTVKRLSSVYDGTFDRQKFAAVVQLLNFNSDPIYQTGTQYSSNVASDSFYEGKEEAIATMEALGVKGTSDLSIFGYLTVNNEGQTVMKYSEPTAIMEMRNTWYGASDIDVANIEARLKADGIRLQDRSNGYYIAKAQGKKALKQYKSDWNAKVVKSLAPYITERGVDSVMNNAATRDLLDNYLYVDNPYQTKSYLTKIFENE